MRLLPTGTVGWEDVDLPAEVLGELRAFCGDVALAGHALPLVLAGPEATGKTRAAQAICGALRLDLFEVRLAGFPVPPLLDQAAAHHFSLVLTPAEKLRPVELGALLERIPGTHSVVFFETRRLEALDPTLPGGARVVDLSGRIGFKL